MPVRTATPSSAAKRTTRQGELREEGYATAEFAVVIPSVVAVAALAMWAVLVVVAQLRCVDAAGVGARALARGEAPASVHRAIDLTAPAGAHVMLGREGDRVTVTVSATVPLPGLWSDTGPRVTVTDTAVAVAEDTAAAAARDNAVGVARDRARGVAP